MIYCVQDKSLKRYLSVYLSIKLPRDIHRVVIEEHQQLWDQDLEVANEQIEFRSQATQQLLKSQYKFMMEANKSSVVHSKSSTGGQTVTLPEFELKL